MTARAVLDGISVQTALALGVVAFPETPEERDRADSEITGNIERLTNAIEAVLAMADEWEAKYGPGSDAEKVLGPQKVSIKFAVSQLRAAVEAALTKDGQ